jgi:hypothetical protein
LDVKLITFSLVAIMHFFLLLSLISFLSNAYAQSPRTPRPLQTARLNSTSGAGVGSLLVAESAILNPAPTAFFQDTYVSYQKNNVDLSNASTERITNADPFGQLNTSESYYLFDNSSELRGGLSYQHQREDGMRRKRITATASSLIKDNLSFGVLFKYTEDTQYLDTGNRHRVSNPFTLGFTYIYHPGLIFGGVWEDPTRASVEESRAILGFQASLSEKIVLIFDVGGDPTTDFNDSRLWRGAIQIALFSDVYIRGGKYQDRSLFLEGESWGVAWIGPKLGAEFSIRTSRPLTDKSTRLYNQERLTDASFALHLRF